MLGFKNSNYLRLNYLKMIMAASSVVVIIIIIGSVIARPYRNKYNDISSDPKKFQEEIDKISRITPKLMGFSLFPKLLIQQERQ